MLISFVSMLSLLAPMPTDITTTVNNDRLEPIHSLRLKQAQDCRAMANDKQRLACFDNVFSLNLHATQKLPMPLEKTLSDQKDLPSKSINKEQEKNFGSTHLQDKEAKPKPLDTVTFVLEKIAKTGRKRQVFYFTNGQVWENKTSQELRVKAGDSVSIRDGALSAFYLSKLDGYRSVRVKRIK